METIASATQILAHSIEQATRSPFDVEAAKDEIERAARSMLEALDCDLKDETLINTPSRFARAMIELTSGYREDPEAILETAFDDGGDEMVIVKGVPYFSLCEHHALPFAGEMTVGYIPRNGRIVGLSKIPRLIHCFARRFQIQERLTRQVADAMVEHLDPLGVAVVARAKHLCMAMRGVRSEGEMISSAMLGVFRDDRAARGEFLSLAGFRSQ